MAKEYSVYELNRIQQYIMQMRPVLKKEALFSDGTKDYSVHNRYPAIPEAKRYVVEQLDFAAYTTYVLNRGEQGKAISADVLDSDIYPIFAVTPCYDAATAKQYGLYTIYLYPAFIKGSTAKNFSYLGYSDWDNTKCIVTNVN